MKKLELIGFSVLMNLIVASQSFAAPIQFNRFADQFQFFVKSFEPINPNDEEAPLGLSGLINEKYLGIGLGEFKNILTGNTQYQSAQIFEYVVNQAGVDYTLEVLSLPGLDGESAEAVYVFRQGIAVGYCLIDHPIIVKGGQSNTQINQIKSLGQVTLPDIKLGKRLNLSTFQRFDGEFVERYSILDRPTKPQDGIKSNRVGEVLMDAYYPKVLDEILMHDFIIGSINNYISSIDDDHDHDHDHD